MQTEQTDATTPRNLRTLGKLAPASPAVRLKQIAVAAAVTLAVASLGTLTWVPLLVSNTQIAPQIPWSIPVEALALVIIWLYLNGWGWPHSTAGLRRSLLRARPLPLRIFVHAWLAGGLALIALAGLWIVLVELTGAGGNPTLPDADQYPPLLLGLAVVMASLVSPISEEAAFRGYGQVLLERSFGPTTAVVLSSLFFAVYHGPTQGFAPSKLFFYFVVGVVFGATAYLTGSVLPAIPVHVAGDLLFFTLIWPHDASRPFVWSTGPEPTFWLSLVQTVLFASLALLAFRRLSAKREFVSSSAER